MPNDETHFTNQDRKVLTQLEVNVGNLLSDIKKFTESFVEKAEFIALTLRVSNLEDNNKWLVRTVIGFVIVALLGLVIVSRTS